MRSYDDDAVGPRHCNASILREEGAGRQAVESNRGGPPLGVLFANRPRPETEGPVKWLLL